MLPLIVFSKAYLISAPSGINDPARMSRRINDIRHDRACGRMRTRALAVEHDRVKHISVNHDPVEYSVHGKKRAVRTNHIRRDLGIIGAVHLAAGSKQSYDPAKLLSVKHILFCHMGDALRRNRLIIDLLSCHYRAKDRYLAAGIISFDVRFRIALRVTLLLRLLENTGHLASVMVHLGQDIIRRSVQYACYLIDIIYRQHAARQGTDDRYASADARFIHEIHVMFDGELHKLNALRRNEVLVGSDHALAGLEHAAYEFKRRMLSAHGLNHDLDLRVVDNNVDIMNKNTLYRIPGKFPQVQNIFYPEFFAQVSLDNRLIGINNIVYARTNRPITHNSYLNHKKSLSMLQILQTGISPDLLNLCNTVSIQLP